MPDSFSYLNTSSNNLASFLELFSKCINVFPCGIAGPHQEDLRDLSSYAIDESRTRIVDDAMAIDSKSLDSQWVFVADPTQTLSVEVMKEAVSIRGIDKDLVRRKLSLDAAGFDGSVVAYKFGKNLRPSSIIRAKINRPTRFNHSETAELVKDRKQGVELRNLLCAANRKSECCESATPNEIKQLVQKFMGASCEFAGNFAKENGIPFIYRMQEDRGSPAKFSPTPGKHVCLKSDSYAQVTSPLRRWGDLINQHQLVAFLSGSQLPFDKEAIKQAVTQLNEAREKKFWPRTISMDENN